MSAGAIIVVAVLGAGLLNVSPFWGRIMGPWARIVRQVLSGRNQEYVIAARMIGTRDRAILLTTRCLIA